MSPSSGRPATTDPQPEQGMSRRWVLTRSAAGVGIALSGSYAGLFGAGAASASPGSAPGKPGPAGYGPLVDDPAGLLSLPASFSYTVVAESGVTRLDSGEPSPSDPGPEDGDGASHLVGSSESGETFFFARNEDPGESEFTGPNFSQDKKILFANIQSPGWVFAIQGPFTKQR